MMSRRFCQSPRVSSQPIHSVLRTFATRLPIETIAGGQLDACEATLGKGQLPRATKQRLAIQWTYKPSVRGSF